MFDFLKKWFSKEETQEALNKTKEVAGDVANKTKDVAVDVANKTQEKAAVVAETVKDKVEEVQQGRDAKEVVGEVAADVVEKTKEVASDVSQKAQEKTAEVTEVVKEKVAEFQASKETPEEAAKTLQLYAVANGEVVTIDKVSDPVFSQKFMGDGYAVLPTDGTITAPVDGEVTNVFPTKHAVGFKTASGVEVLLHMGLDTVELKGEPFNTVVNEGDQVTAGTVVSTVDLEAVKAAGKDTPMIVALTNMDVISDVTINEGPTNAQATIGNAIVK